MRPYRQILGLALVALMGSLWSADAQPVQPKPVVTSPVVKDKPAAEGKPAVEANESGPSANTKAAEEAWIFEPPAGRIDAFADVEKRMELEKSLADPKNQEAVGVATIPRLEEGQIEVAIKWARAEAERVDRLILARRWEEAIQACDKASSSLAKYQEHAEIQQLRESFARARHQANEAKIFEEAQAKFDALGIRVDGILWAADGSLAVIHQEPRALSINDRTRDCTIVNIDTNRVDFLFTYEQRRFEFQRYVGEEVRARAGAR